MVNGRVQFKAATGYISIPSETPLNFNGTHFSISFGVTPDSLRNATLLEKFNNTADIGYKIRINDGKVVLSVNDGTVSANVVTADIALGVRQVIAFVFNALGMCTPYINGIAGTQVNVSAVGNFNNVDPLIIGAAYDEAGVDLIDFYVGALDDIKVYKSILTLEQIGLLYNDNVKKEYSVLDAGAAAFVLMFSDDIVDDKVYSNVPYSPTLVGSCYGTLSIEFDVSASITSHFTTTEKFKGKLSKLAADNLLTFQAPDEVTLLRRLTNAYEEIASKLVARGLTELAISTWRRGEEFQLDIATYWYAKDCGWGGKLIEEKDWTKVFNRTLELETITIISNEGIVLKAGSGPVAVGMNLIDINTKLGVL